MTLSLFGYILDWEKNCRVEREVTRGDASVTVFGKWYITSIYKYS